MSKIHIARGQQNLGSFVEGEIRAGILSGRFTAEDLSWREGMPAWRPLGEMAPQWDMHFPAASDVVGAAGIPPEITPVENQPAWEDRASLGLFASISQTVSAVLFRPAETFARLRQTGGLASPLLYFVLLNSVMFAVAAFYQIAAAAMNSTVLSSQFQHTPKSSLLVGLIGSVLISPALYVVASFLGSGIIHLCLMLLGAAARPFETTFRVYCYAHASAAVLNIFPLCGGMIGVIWGAVCIIIGLRETHGIPAWKATLAILMPGLLCCGILFLVGVANAGVGISEIMGGLSGLQLPQAPKTP